MIQRVKTVRVTLSLNGFPGMVDGSVADPNSKMVNPDPTVKKNAGQDPRPFDRGREKERRIRIQPLRKIQIICFFFFFNVSIDI